MQLGHLSHHCAITLQLEPWLSVFGASSGIVQVSKQQRGHD